MNPKFHSENNDLHRIIYNVGILPMYFTCKLFWQEAPLFDKRPNFVVSFCAQMTSVNTLWAIKYNLSFLLMRL